MSADDIARGEAIIRSGKYAPPTLAQYDAEQAAARNNHDLYGVNSRPNPSPSKPSRRVRDDLSTASSATSSAR